MNRIADAIDSLTGLIGRTVAWLALAIVLLQFVLVLARYLFGVGSIWLNESVMYGHATLFLMAAAWTLQAGGHVRVDVFYAEAGPRTRAVIDLVGSLLLLLPFALLVLYLALPFAARSWAVLERSQETSGLPFVYLLKTLVPVFAVLMALQGIAQAIRSVTVLRGERHNVAS